MKRDYSTDGLTQVLEGVITPTMPEYTLAVVVRRGWYPNPVETRQSHLVYSWQASPGEAGTESRSKPRMSATRRSIRHRLLLHEVFIGLATDADASPLRARGRASISTWPQLRMLIDLFPVLPQLRLFLDVSQCLALGSAS